MALYKNDEASAEGASTWVINLRASVRPIITYIFVTILLVVDRSEEHTSELQSQSTISYAVFCLNTKNESIGSEVPKYSQKTLAVAIYVVKNIHGLDCYTLL